MTIFNTLSLETLDISDETWNAFRASLPRVTVYADVLEGKLILHEEFVLLKEFAFHNKLENLLK